jgi:hypothetical protein
MNRNAVETEAYLYLESINWKLKGDCDTFVVVVFRTSFWTQWINSLLDIIPIKYFRSSHLNFYSSTIWQEICQTFNLSIKEFIRWFHKSRIPNLLWFIIYACFLTGKLKKKNYLDQYEVCFLFQLLKLRKIREKIQIQIGENIWWVLRYMTNMSWKPK